LGRKITVSCILTTIHGIPIEVVTGVRECEFDDLHPKMVYYYGNGQRRDVTGSESSINLPFAGTNNMEMCF
jgi:hypothetical protein